MREDVFVQVAFLRFHIYVVEHARRSCRFRCRNRLLLVPLCSAAIVTGLAPVTIVREGRGGSEETSTVVSDSFNKNAVLV